jgi:hypothetical protein
VPGFVKLKNAPAIDDTAYTLSLWVRPDEIPTEKSTGGAMGDNLKAVAGLLTKTSECHFGGLCLVPDAKDQSKGHFTMGHLVWFSAFPETATSSEAYAPGQWHHVVGVADPMGQDPSGGQSRTASGAVRIYVDGKLAGKVHHEGGSLGSFFKFGKNGGNFYLGACQPGDVPQRDDRFKCRGSFKGAIDEVRIYKRALTDAEVAALYEGVASMPPTVSIRRPAANASLAAPSAITLQAAANDPDGDVAQVDYYLGSVAAGNKLNAQPLTTAPFTFVWRGAQPGTYSVIAVATDDTGVTAKSGPIAVTVK